jgi:hypothetical protein
MLEFVVIALSLVGIGNGEAGDCFVKDVAFPDTLRSSLDRRSAHERWPGV